MSRVGGLAGRGEVGTEGDPQSGGAAGTCFLLAALPTSPTEAPQPSPGGGGLPGTHIKVDGWRPGDADGLGLAALHRASGGLNGEALVLQGCDVVHAELNSLQALVLSAGRWVGTAPGNKQPCPQP